MASTFDTVDILLVETWILSSPRVGRGDVDVALSIRGRSLVAHR